MLDLLLHDMEERLGTAGFKRVHEQEHPQAFGSREIVWAGPTGVLRLVWDGKESWIILEARPSNGINWEELRLEKVRRDGLDENGRKVLIQALDTWLSSS